MKIWNYITIITGTSIMLALAGLNVAGISDLLRIIGVTIKNSVITQTPSAQNTLWNFVFGSSTGILTTIGTTGAIGLGLYVYTKDKSYLIIGIITGVWFYWISALYSIIQVLKEIDIFGLILAIPLLVLSVGFIQSCIDFFQGVD